MKLIGIENCPSCRVVKKFLPELPYIQLKRGERSTAEILSIKKALGVLNPTNKFPVVVSDDNCRLVDTKYIMDHLNLELIRNKIQNE